MRITNRMMSSNYMTDLNASLESLIKINEKVSTGRSFQKASENPAAALKAYQLRQNLSRLSLYQANVGEAGDILTDVESAVSEINSILTNVMEKVVQGKSDTANEENRTAIAEVIRNCQNEILDIANSKSSDKYIFGGSDMTRPPFALEGGVLCYHGTDVNDNTPFPGEAVNYDIGLGLRIGEGGAVTAGTALDIAYPGSAVFGTGTDENGMSNNIYNFLGQMAQLFEDNSLDDVDAYLGRLETVSKDIMIQYVNVGQKTNFIEFLQDRFSANEFNSLSKQSSLEGIDEAEGILEYKTQEMAYQAALAMGAKIIQPSLLDYLR